MIKPGFKLFNAVNSEEVEIYLYGNIGRYWHVDIQVIIPRIEQLKANGLKRITFYVNSDGGEVPQGILLFNYLVRNDFEVTFIVDGVAASMAAGLLNVPGATVEMAKYGKLMIHSVSGCACGKISEIRDYADNMEDWQKDLVEIIATRTGLTKDEVNSKWFDEKDHWINSADALELGLVDKIIEGKGNIKPASNVTNSLDVMLHYENQLFNITDDTMKLTNDFAQVLNLTGQQTEESILESVRKVTGELTSAKQSIQEKEDKITSMEAKLKANDKEKVTALVDNAITEKKIGEDMRETYTKLAEQNFEATEKALGRMTGVKKIKGNLENSGEDDTHKGWSFQKYQKEDSTALAAMKEKTPEQYKALYNKAFGKDPVE